MTNAIEIIKNANSTFTKGNTYFATRELGKSELTIWDVTKGWFQKTETMKITGATYEEACTFMAKFNESSTVGRTF